MRFAIRTRPGHCNPRRIDDAGALPGNVRAGRWVGRLRTARRGNTLRCITFVILALQEVKVVFLRCRPVFSGAAAAVVQ